MKAAQVNKYGGTDVIEINNDAPMPELKANRILVEIYAASINPFDSKMRNGLYIDSIPIQFPYIPGGDFSGVVKELGKDVSVYKTGDEVFGSALVLSGGSGAFAEYAVANVENNALKPKKVGFEEAASLPLVGSSAVQALEEHIKLQKNQKILIHGGAGGIGSIAVQLAKHIGAYVSTTVSPDDIGFVKQLGADQIIDYKNERFEEIVADLDAVFDTVGGETAEKSFKILKKGGILVSMLGEPDPELAQKFGVVAIGQSTQTNRRHLERLAKLVDESSIKPQVDKIFPLDQARKAFDFLEKGSPRGKVVLRIKD